MKKIISIALLLAMVLGIFAGCNLGKETKPAENPLDAAVAYLKNMYDKSTKDEDNKLTANKELLPAVTIDGVSYPVTWEIQVTAGPTDCIVMGAGAAAGTQKIEVAKQPEEEVRFNLIGTVKDAAGNTATITIKFYSPAVQKVEVEDGKQVVIYLVADSKYMTGIDYLYTSSSSGKQKHELALTDNKAEAIAMTLVTNDDGTVTFKTANNMYLFCDATHVMFVAEESDYTKFILEAAEGGQYIKCAVANFGDKPQYLEVYSGYMTCYGISESSNLDLYIFELQDAEGANGTVGEVTPSCEHDYVEGTCTKCGAADPNYNPNPDTNNDPAADSTLTIAEAIARGASKAHNTYTEGKYYVTGVITEVYNTTYGNMKITDEAGNILTIYGTYDADGTNRYDAMATQPVAGDTVTIYGIIGQYNDTPQMKNGWIVAHTPAGSEPNPNPNPNPNPDPSGAPEVGVAYKFGMIQPNVSTTDVYYLAGGMNGYYMATTTNASAAINVYLETANGGYYLYTMEGSTKVYINMVVSGTHVNGAYEASASTVYTWDAENKTLVAEIDGNLYWFGTRNDKNYTTVGPCKTSYEGFFCTFYKA